MAVVILLGEIPYEPTGGWLMPAEASSPCSPQDQHFFYSCFTAKYINISPFFLL